MPDTGPNKVQVVEGDITQVAADAIVNAANSELQAGGGVCGAIFRAAGIDRLTEACRAIRHCPTGEAVITPAFGIRSAKYVIHAVGPVYARHTPEDARRLLRSAYAASIRLAAQHGCRTVAFPAISTGVYGYPLQEACREAVEVCRAEGAAAGMELLLVAFDGETAAVMRALVDGRS